MTSLGLWAFSLCTFLLHAQKKHYILSIYIFLPPLMVMNSKSIVSFQSVYIKTNIATTGGFFKARVTLSDNS